MAKTRLSIYLIKEGITEHSEIIKSIQRDRTLEIDRIGTFYYWPSYASPPSWVGSFFNNTLAISDLLSSNAKGVFLVPVDIPSEQSGTTTMPRIFALTFGSGSYSLKPDVFEERFGLICTLNVVGKLRKVQTKNISSIPKDISEQLSKEGEIADFAIDPEQCLVKNITGVSTNLQFGKMISGKDSLNVTVERNINNIKEFLRLCYEKYICDDYKQDYEWIDQIAEVNSPGIKENLNSTLVSKIENSHLQNIWMAVPDIIPWEQVSGFKYNKRGELYDDIDLPEFLNSLSDEKRNNLSIGYLKNKSIFCMRANESDEFANWSVYKCLYCEVRQERQVYLLSNGKWYEINADYAARINQEFEDFRSCGSSIELPPMSFQTDETKLEKENDYNLRAAQQNPDLYCLDCNTISHGSAHSKIEFCDLFSRDNKIIHVKKYGASSVLSHLFSQGTVSGELFLRDKDFRDKLNAKLPDNWKLNDTNFSPNATDYEIIYAIVSSHEAELGLPFFSKVTLNAAKNRLKLFGYKVSLLKIETAKL